MARIGLFGGTFDPVHTGHIKLIKTVISTFSLDRLILIPTGNPHHKKNDITDKQHRYQMVQIMAEPLLNVSVSDYEVVRSAPGYSYETILYFKEQYPNDELFFIVGGDSFRDFPKWKNYETLLTLCTFIVVSRPGVLPEDYFKHFTGEETPPRVLFLKDFCEDISSTEVRTRIASGESIEHLVPKPILEYINTHHLYR